jgi:hypothetical protein
LHHEREIAIYGAPEWNALENCRGVILQIEFIIFPDLPDTTSPLRDKLQFGKNSPVTLTLAWTSEIWLLLYCGRVFKD